MKQKALVLSADGNTAVIEVARVTACENCHRLKAGEGCAVCSLFDLQRKMKAEALNEVGAVPGDIVEIMTPTRTVLFYSALVFVFPLLIGLAVYFCASLFIENEAALAGIAALGVLLTFAVIHFTVDRTAASRRSLRIVAVCRKGEEAEQ